MYARIVAAVAALTLVLVLAVPAPATGDACARPSSSQLAQLPVQWPAFRRALVSTFGAGWQAAAVVAYGESRWSPSAANGQYLGYFQMGAYERARTGWSSDAAGQVRAASLWNRMTGGRWGRWSCRP